MTYKKFLELLKWDYSNEQLEEFLSTEHFHWKDYGVKTDEQRRYVKEVYVPQLIKDNEKENAIMAEQWAASPIMRLAFVRCQQKRIHLSKENAVYFIAVEAEDIINHLDKDDTSVGIKNLLKHYCKHLKAGHYDTDTAI